ncbi:polymorphic toxin type 44 domain-containing protein [Streptomyces sp. NPDC057486]|uniref:polymorphic toxin type 44 domain-containing protein n=1 Tax=Streptomyces sp. NPDC057486 TaxID=3346145 RepID=UPI0036A6336A
MTCRAHPIQYKLDCDPGRSVKPWFDQVHENGPWDHKTFLLKNFALHQESNVCCYTGKITGMNAEVYHDVWSNVHYGYAGAAAGLDDDLLEFAAAPSLPGGKNIPGAEHIPYVGRSDEGDKATVRFGIDLWKKYGADLTQGQFHSELLNMFGDLQGTDKIYSLAPPPPTMEKVPGGWVKWHRWASSARPTITRHGGGQLSPGCLRGTSSGGRPRMKTDEARDAPGKKSTSNSAGAWLLGITLFLMTGYVTSLLLFSTWTNCDIGANNPYQLVLLVAVSTGMATASSLLWALMRKLTGRRGLLKPLALTVLAVAVLLWPVLAVWYVSPGHPDSVCTSGGTPLGWPTWLPV